jgi:hypothetical protein
MAGWNLRDLAAARACLSAGQKRRLGLARLLVSDRPVWLLDEPTVSLDVASVALFAGVLRAIWSGAGGADRDPYRSGSARGRELDLTPLPRRCPGARRAPAGLTRPSCEGAADARSAVWPPAPAAALAGAGVLPDRLHAGALWRRPRGRQARASRRASCGWGAAGLPAVAGPHLCAGFRGWHA